MSKIILILSCFVFFICGCQKKEPHIMPPIPVTAVRIEPQTVPVNFEYVGVAESSHIVEIRARVEGYLESINYKEGALVHSGDLLFVLDQRPFIAAVEEARGNLAREEALLWNAQQIKNRMVPLYDQNAISQKDLDDAIAGELSAQASVDIADANVYKADVNLSYTNIAAPVTGMASRAIFREGALISPGPNDLMTQIYVIDPMWVNFSVSDLDILKARDEMKQKLLTFPKNKDFEITIVLADGSLLPGSGYIDFLNPAIQQSTGTMLVRSVIPNPDYLIKPGQFVRVILKGAYRENATLVPQSAVVQGASGSFVYVINSTGEIEARPVILGDWYLDYWMINSGLKSGDVVVAEGVNRIRVGSKVTITSYKSSKPNPKSNEATQGNTIGF
jgi:membrane fusion protein (multidrug efflux system)